MSLINGNNITYTVDNIVLVYGSIIRRTGVGILGSTDIFPSASSLILSILGENNDTYNGYTFSLSVYNNTLFNITQTFGSGMTAYPTISTIIGGGMITYIFIQTSGTTMDVFIKDD